MCCVVAMLPVLYSLGFSYCFLVLFLLQLPKAQARCLFFSLNVCLVSRPFQLLTNHAETSSLSQFLRSDIRWHRTVGRTLQRLDVQHGS
jgi:hypothetical protein